MRNKDVENRIISALEKETPSKSVLDRAKTEIKIKKARNYSKPVFRYAIITFVVIIVAIAVILPITLTANKNDYVVLSYDSMQQFFADNDIDLQTFDSNGYGNNPGASVDPSEQHPSGIVSSQFKRGECKVIKVGEQTVAIEEEYVSKINDNVIKIAILLFDNIQIRNKYFAGFIDLEKNVSKEDVIVYYSYDKSKHFGRGQFGYKNYTVYISGDAADEEAFLQYCICWIQKQK